MVAALGVLLVALGFVLYHDRDFWFPGNDEAENQPLAAAPATPAGQPGAASSTSASSRSKSFTSTSRKKSPARVGHSSDPAPTAAVDAPDAAAPPTTITRTVLPPLEVEVVAGSVHKTVRPGTNSVHVDLQSESSQNATEAPPSPASEATANVMTEAAERTQISTDTASLVTRSVRPGYPMLARQMKVQGSVILQALIGRDGLIQDLRVLSGPPILASAAQEAVKQWHFKPHYEGTYAVETQAKITVNFTISTN